MNVPLNVKLLNLHLELEIHITSRNFNFTTSTVVPSTSSQILICTNRKSAPRAFKRHITYHFTQILQSHMTRWITITLLLLNRPKKLTIIATIPLEVVWGVSIRLKRHKKTLNYYLKCVLSSTSFDWVHNPSMYSVKFSRKREERKKKKKWKIEKHVLTEQMKF